LQVNYLGYPGTLGAGYMDYVIADPTVLPPGAGDHYAEKIIHLPHSYQANDSRRAIADRVFSRTELGLPAQGFVFCCFNNTYKILPAVFARWMRILNDVPGSVLWLLGTDAAVVASLRRWAQAAGIEPDRLIFTTRMALPEHLARHRAADLFLDTLPYNAHTTASDALWAGLPLLTCSGESFASRVAASLLRAIDLPELIAPTPQRYEELAVELALDPPRLAAIRTTLGRHRLTKPLFDTRLYARHLEAAYASIYDRYQQDLPPDNIRVTTGDIPAQSADESVRAHE
jgi:predicted O-linked N-acetylglucosamine transferase (SPINDLY family)